MKKISIAIITVLMCALAMFAACKTNDDATDKDYTVEVSQTAITLDVYDKYDLTATVFDGDGNEVDEKIVWTSSNAGAVEVQDGKIFAKAMGAAQVTAKVDGGSASATVNVTVEMKGKIPTLVLAESAELSLAANGKFDLSPKVMFKGADATDADTAFTYEVKNPEIATVENGTITAKAAGSTEITVTASWRGLGGPSMVGSEDALGLKITLKLTVKP